ncbi:MAG: hypothetical protein WD738_04855 [Pirellulales bacterium]
MKSHLNKVRSQRRDNPLAWMAVVAVLSGTVPASAEIVTVWEDQFTSISPDWVFPANGLTLVSQPVPGDVVGSEDGFEGRFTNTVGSVVDIYIRRTIPAGLVQAGDRVEYSIRTQYPTNYAGDRINLVAPPGGTDFDSGFVGHDSPGALTYQKEPGTLFDLFDTTLMSGLRPTDNLWFGNNGWGGSGVESIFYVDYIRIVGERASVNPDFNGDGTIDAADYVVWRKNDGSQAGYDAWRANFGMMPGSGAGLANGAAVPEPAAACLAIMGILMLNCLFRRQSFGFSAAGG